MGPHSRHLAERRETSSHVTGSHTPPLWIHLTVSIALSLSVPQYRGDVHAHFQPHLPDVAAGTLERLSTVPCPDAAGFPQQLLGRH